MKVALFCNEYPPRPHGGIGSFTQTYARGLAERGHEVTIVEATDVARAAGERRDGAVRIASVPVGGWHVPRTGWYTRRRALWRWLSERAMRGEFDVVEVPDFEGWLPFNSVACPVVVRLHNTQTGMARFAGDRPRATTRWCERQTLARHPYWIGVSKFILETTHALFGVTPKMSVAAYNPAPSIDDEASPHIDGKPYVLFVGSVRRDKGALKVAEAAKIFLPARPQLRLVYLGEPAVEDGRRADQRIAEIVGPELSPRVELPGRKPADEVRRWMRGARAIVCPSRFEAFSMVPLEAMSCGTPLVYTRAASGPEAVEHGVSGLLADPDDAADIAMQVGRILDDDALASRLVEGARRAVSERFSVARCVDVSVDFYRQVPRPG